MHEVVFDTEKPIYLQLMQDIMARVVRGELNVGDKIPSAREFASQKLVNPNTVARAYQELERSGFIETRRGLGSFIVADAEHVELAKQQLVNDAVGRLYAELGTLGMSVAEMLETLQHKLGEKS